MLELWFETYKHKRMYITVYCTYELYINRYVQYKDFEFTEAVNTNLIHTTRKFKNFYMTYMYASTFIYIRRSEHKLHMHISTFHLDMYRWKVIVKKWCKKLQLILTLIKAYIFRPHICTCNCGVAISFSIYTVQSTFQGYRVMVQYVHVLYTYSGSILHL